MPGAPSSVLMHVHLTALVIGPDQCVPEISNIKASDQAAVSTWGYMGYRGVVTRGSLWSLDLER